MTDKESYPASFEFPTAVRRDTETVWQFHHMRHTVRACDAAVVLGCHDIGVADVAADAWARELAPVFVVTGATSAATRERFPGGEAAAFAARMRSAGTPDETILVESRATNTGANITLSREVLEQRGVSVSTVLLVTMPYMERRAYATCKAAWPEVKPICLSAPVTLADYLTLMVDRDGMDPRLVIDMMVGDLQRVIEYPALGFQIAQEVPDEVHAAYKSLVAGGFDSRLAG